MITPYHDGPWKSSWVHQPLTADGEPSACLARRRLRCVPWYWPPTPRRGRDQPQASAARTARRQEWRQARRRARGKGIAKRVGGQCGEHHVAVWLQAAAAPFALRTNRICIMNCHAHFCVGTRTSSTLSRRPRCTAFSPPPPSGASPPLRMTRTANRYSARRTSHTGASIDVVNPHSP